MRPPPWLPPVPLSAAETRVVGAIRHAKLFPFLRRIRHQLFDAAFQQELAALYDDGPQGPVPVAPAQLALVTLLQAYTGASDDEAIERLVMDRRWQLVLDCLGAETSPVSKATLVRFRGRLLASGLDRRLLERTVELAEQAGGFGPRALRAALDASPLWGAGRVEDTLNLLGHALRDLVGVLAVAQGRERTALAAAIGVPAVTGSSLKAALDRDWTTGDAPTQALGAVLGWVEQVQQWLDGQPAATTTPGVADGLAVVAQIQAQDVTTDEQGQAVLRAGVAKDRRVSVSDGQMRHGRKSRSVRVDGYKRHVLVDLDTDLVRAVGVTAANAAEATVTEAIRADLAAQGATVGALWIDRGYLSSRWVAERGPDLAVYCKAWPVRNGTRHTKAAFTLDWDQQLLTCPAGVMRAFTPGGVVRFGAACATCGQRDQCTTRKRGRSVQIHPDERLLTELRARQQTVAGRAVLRQRVVVEHTLAHIGHWQGDRARYRGLRKNVFDLRRMAMVHNLHVHARLVAAAPPAHSFAA